MLGLKRKEVSVLECLAIIIFSVLSILLQAFCLFKLWVWFAVPLGLIYVPVKAFVGLLGAKSVLTVKIQPEGTPEESADFQWSKLSSLSFLYLFVMLIGWMATIFL